MGKTAGSSQPLSLASLRGGRADLSKDSVSAVGLERLRSGYFRPAVMLDSRRENNSYLSLTQMAILPPFSAVYPDYQTANDEMWRVLRAAKSELEDVKDEEATATIIHLYRFSRETEPDGRRSKLFRAGSAQEPLVVARVERGESPDNPAEECWGFRVFAYDPVATMWQSMRRSGPFSNPARIRVYSSKDDAESSGRKQIDFINDLHQSAQKRFHGENNLINLDQLGLEASSPAR